MKFELKMAWRHLVSSHGQTELTVGAVAVGVLLVVFLSSLINGLQAGLIEDVVGSIPHVVVEANEKSVTPLWDQTGQGGVTGNIVTSAEKIPVKRRSISNWRNIEAAIRQLPDVETCAPTVEGSGIVGRGSKNVGATIIGTIPEEQMKVSSLSDRIVEGDFNLVDQQNAAIGIKMSEELGAALGSRIKVTSEEGVVNTYRIAAIFDMGMENANESRVYVGLSSAQSAFKVGKDITNLNIKGKDLFSANVIAEQVRGISGLKVISWMESNKAFLDTLKAQNSSAAIIQAMTLLASAFGVASVMIVFVVQKAKDIGILKSMGATARQIQRVFVIEGLGVGMGGAIVGSGIGTGLCFLAENIYLRGETFGGKAATIVPMSWDINYVFGASLVAIIVGLLSSIVPAFRAAKLDCVEAIRRG